MRLLPIDSCLVEEPPRSLQISAPQGVDWFAGSGNRWLATRGEGPECELLVTGASGWLDTGFRGRARLVPNGNGEALFIRDSIVWSLTLEGDTPRLSALARVEGVRAATRLNAHIVLLSSPNVLSLFDGAHIVGAWTLGKGDFEGLRTLHGGSLLLATETTWTDDGTEAQTLHVLFPSTETIRRVACLRPDGDVPEEERMLGISSQITTLFQSSDGAVSCAQPLPPDTLAGDQGFLRLEGLAEISAGDGEALTPTAMPTITLDGLPELPPAQPFGDTKTPAPRRDGFVDVLIERLKEGGRRSEPRTEVMELVAGPMPDELRALLQTWAHFDVSPTVFESIDWWLAEPCRDDRLRGNAKTAFRLGTMANGHPYVAQVFADGTATFVNLDDEGCEYFASSSLNDLLKTLVERERSKGNLTIFDNVDRSDSLG